MPVQRVSKKAAVVAAQRGHQVTVHEMSRRVGGQVRLAERLPGRAEFGGAITNLQHEIARYGVPVHTGSVVDAATIEQERPDVVVIATGGSPYRPEFEFTEDATVFDVDDVIDGAQVPAGRALVIDTMGDWAGIGVATLLAQDRHRVTLATTGYQAGERIQQYVRDEMLKGAIRAGVELLPLCRLYGADGDTAYLQHVLTGEPVIVGDISCVVLALGRAPRTELEHALAQLPPERRPAVHVIGDALAPRTVEEAILEGMRVGHAI